MAVGIQNLKSNPYLSGKLQERPPVRALAQAGIKGDTEIAHMTPGEMVLPASLQSPGIMALLAKEARYKGYDPSQLVVGSPEAQRNPSTGAQMFADPYYQAMANWQALDYEDPATTSLQEYISPAGAQVRTTPYYRAGNINLSNYGRAGAATPGEALITGAGAGPSRIDTSNPRYSYNSYGEPVLETPGRSSAASGAEHLMSIAAPAVGGYAGLQAGNWMANNAADMGIGSSVSEVVGSPDFTFGGLGDMFGNAAIMGPVGMGIGTAAGSLLTGDDWEDAAIKGAGSTVGYLAGPAIAGSLLGSWAGPVGAMAGAAIASTIFGGDDDDSVICTELVKQNLLPQHSRRQNLLYAHKMLTPRHIHGYHLWGKPVARLIKRGIGRRFWLWMATRYSAEIERRVNGAPTTDWAGRLIYAALVPLCGLLGYIAPKSDLSKGLYDASRAS